jgi:hypothetical protein
MNMRWGALFLWGWLTACSSDTSPLGDGGILDGATGDPLCEGALPDLEDSPCPRVTAYCVAEHQSCCRADCVPDFTCTCETDGWQCSRTDLPCLPLDSGT